MLRIAKLTLLQSTKSFVLFLPELLLQFWPDKVSDDIIPNDVTAE